MDDFQKTLERIANTPIQRKPKGCLYNALRTFIWILLVRAALFAVEYLIHKH